MSISTRGLLSVRQTVERAERGRVIGTPKTRESHRDVELIDPARDALLGQRRRQAARRLASVEWADTDLVFSDEFGRPLNPDRVRRQFKSLLTAEGLDVVPFKNLRHTFATMHLDTGISDLVVSKALGHSRPSTTNTYYRRVNRRHQRDAAVRLQALLADDSVAGSVAGGEVSVGSGDSATGALARASTCGNP